MSVSNGQIANASTFNNAFMSRTADTSTTGKVDLLNAGSATITDAQLVINNILVDLANAETDIDNLENNRVIKAPSSTDNALARFDGTTGQQIQDSLVTVSDTGSMIVPEDLTVQGNLTVEGTLTSVNSTNLEVEDQNITVNKGGSDITAEGAGLTVERTGVDGSFVYQDSLVSKWKAGAVGSEVEIATVSGAQVLTNKDIDGGVAANNRRITLPKDTLANLTALTRKAGTVVYATDTQKFYYDNGTSLIDPAAGASGAIDQTVGSADANKLIKTGSDGFLDESFNVKEPSFASESAFTTFLGRASQTGDRYFNTTDKKFYVYDGTAFIVASGSGGGGVVNLITNGNADDAVASIFTPYADAAGTRPVDGTGGSPTVTTSITTSTPLNGTKSFLLTKPASNVQGQGWSVLSFTVDPAFRAKVLSITVDYIVNSGTFVAGSNTTDGDVIWYIYDVTNAQLIEPSSIKMFSNSSTISDKYSAAFQTSATGSTYRLIAHVASTSALAYELKVDNVTVSPSQYVYGTPITDWQSYTPTGSWVTNTTYAGRWRRVGQNMEIQARAALTGAPTNSALTITIPSGYSIDTSINQVSNRIGSGYILDTGVNSYPASVLVFSSSAVQIAAYNASFTYTVNQSLSSTVPFTYGSTDLIDFSASFAIVGWSSSVQVSDNADTRVVSASASNSSQVVANTTSPILVSSMTTSYDTHGGFNTGTGRYTIPVSGFYRILGISQATATYANASSFTQINVFVNGVTSGTLQSFQANGALTVNNQYFNGTITLNLKAGDLVDLRFTNQSGNSITVATSVLQIERVTGPSAIAASESVSVSANNTSGQSIPNNVNTTITGWTKEQDTHNAFNATTGIFTAPVNGLYTASLSVTMSGSFTINTGGVFSILQASSGVSAVGTGPFAHAATEPHAGITHTFRLLAGQTITVQTGHNNGVARNLSTADTNRVKFSINKIGN